MIKKLKRCYQMKNNKLTIILFLLILFGFVSIILSMSSFYKDKSIIDSFEKDVLKIRLFNMYENNFNYLHGIYLIPIGLFICCILLILEVPSITEIFKIIKKDLIKKIKKDLKKF